MFAVAALYFISPFVVKAGIEPARGIAPKVFETFASTNSATWPKKQTHQDLHSHLITKTSEHDDYSAYVGKYLCRTLFICFSREPFYTRFFIAEPTFLVCFYCILIWTWTKTFISLAHWITFTVASPTSSYWCYLRARVYQFPFSLNACVFAFCGPRWDLNPWPSACKTDALPDWATSPFR